LIEAKMKIEGFSDNLIKSSENRMLRIDDVRPRSAVLPWLLSIAMSEKEALKDFLEQFIFDFLGNIIEDQFVKEWIEAHDEELKTYDELLDLISNMSVFKFLNNLGKRFPTLETLSKIASKIHRDGEMDPYARRLLKACNKEFTMDEPFEWKVQEKLQNSDCVITGHTHGAKVISLNDKISYLDTGTWRR
jgi:hypothetical protein